MTLLSAVLLFAWCMITDAASTPTPCPPACQPACQPACVSGGALIILTSSEEVVATTRSEYIGITLDYGNICNRTANHSVIGTCVGATNLPLSPSLAHLASMNPRGIPNPQPGFLRIGGSLQDSVLFLGPGESCPVNLSSSRFAPPTGGNQQYQCSQGGANGHFGRCFSTDRMQQMCRFASQSGLKLILGLNACMGRNSIDGPMNISLLEPFLKFVASSETCKGTLYGFELGNELDTHVYHGCDGVEPEALGTDMHALAELNTRLFSSWAAELRPIYAGPDIAAFTGTTAMPDQDVIAGTNYFSRFMNASAGVLSAVTFHQYTYCDRESDTPNLDTVIDLDCLAKMNRAARLLKQVTNKYNRNMELWVGESSNEWTGGIPNRSDVTFDAFYYAEQLQTMASANVSAVVRQDLLGMYYELLSYPDLTPKPSYWVAFLWKLLVGRDVFQTSESSSLPVPVWMHSTVHCGLREGVSRVAFLINFHMTSSAQVTVSIPSLKSQKPPNMTAFILHGPVYSDQISLNGQPLTLNADGSLPTPQGLNVHDGILNLPPTSIAFVEVAGNRKCK